MYGQYGQNLKFLFVFNVNKSILEYYDVFGPNCACLRSIGQKHKSCKKLSLLS